MDKKDEMQSIGELARSAGVSVRTIRYYIDEGLLPQPELRGKYAWFNESYLYRLKLIQQYKDAYLPLREIRARLEQMTPDQVQVLVESSEASARQAGIGSSPSASPTPEPKVSATDYLKDIMEPRRSVPLQMGSILEQRELYDAPPSPQQEGETWQRIPLAAGIELHIKHPLPPRLKVHLRRLVAFARSLFEENIS